MAARPVSSIAMLPGSGVATTWLIDTPSSSEKGGSPFGVPAARNDRTSELLVAGKVSGASCQPVKPWLGSLRTGVESCWPPRLTSHCSVVGPVKPDCWAPAYQKLTVYCAPLV